MAFVNEVNKLGYPVRTVDHERNIVLTRTGMVGEGQKVFTLRWGDLAGEFRARSHQEKGAIDTRGRPDIIGVHWLIEGFKWPDTARRNDFIKLIIESLTAYGFLGRPDWRGKVTVDFHPRVKLHV